MFAASIGTPRVIPLASRAVTVNDGTALLVRPLDPITSNDKAGKKFTARLDGDLVVEGKVTAHAGSIVYGRVEASRSAGKSKLALSLTQIMVKGRPVPIATGKIRGAKSPQ